MDNDTEFPIWEGYKNLEKMKDLIDIGCCHDNKLVLELAAKMSMEREYFRDLLLYIQNKLERHNFLGESLGLCIDSSKEIFEGLMISPCEIIDDGDIDREIIDGAVVIKVPGTNYDVRINKPPEKIEMVAHSADCKYCNGIVKMMRDQITIKLQPDNCSCLMCGQRYYVEIEGGDIDKWEAKQWDQKNIRLGYVKEKGGGSDGSDNGGGETDENQRVNNN